MKHVAQYVHVILYMYVWMFQIYEGLAFMDFAKELFDKQGHGKHYKVIYTKAIFGHFTFNE